ncbi:hypothetical protein DAI22_11g045900 [Oryza sativa Japonica Group]|nr:hypothetical protein DAI22_11g045900 [Oryza sativa Japonica Group]
MWSHGSWRQEGRTARPAQSNTRVLYIFVEYALGCSLGIIFYIFVVLCYGKSMEFRVLRKN